MASTGWDQKKIAKRYWDKSPFESCNVKGVSTEDEWKWTYLDTGQCDYVTKATVCGSACEASRPSCNRYDIRHIVKLRDMEHDEGWCEKSRKQMLTQSDGKWPKVSATVCRSTSRDETKWSSTFRFLSMPKGLHDYTYVLILKDGMSGFCELVPTTVANMEVTVQALIQTIWCCLLMGFGSSLAFQECSDEYIPKKLGCSTSFCYRLLSLGKRDLWAHESAVIESDVVIIEQETTTNCQFAQFITVLSIDA